MGSGKAASFRIGKVIQRMVRDKRANPAATITPIPATSQPRPASGQG